MHRSLALALLLAGCAPPPPMGAPILDPPPAGRGLQLEMVSALDAGQEIERCRLFQIGPEGLWVRKEQTRYTPGSHHVLLFSTPYTELPTKDSQGRPIDPHAVFDCADGAPAAFDIAGVLAGSQTSDGDSSDLEAPDGVALHVPGSAIVLMNTHYLNASSHPVTATARINLWGSPSANNAVEAGVLFFYNFYIRVPPNGTSTARMRCPIPRDATLLNAQSHMHARGVGYAADLLAGDGKSTELYRNSSWSNVPVKSFAPGLPLPAGSAIDYRCEYASSESRTILQGLKTRDEMCMFVGVYYPRDLQLERCALDDSFWTSDLSAVHVGDGNATCGATLDCIDHPPASAPGDDAAVACRLAACPAGADALFAVEKCRMTNADHACDPMCKMRDAACETCLTDKCAPAVAACRASGC